MSDQTDIDEDLAIDDEEDEVPTKSLDQTNMRVRQPKIIRTTLFEILMASFRWTRGEITDSEFADKIISASDVLVRVRS